VGRRGEGGVHLRFAEESIFGYVSHEAGEVKIGKAICWMNLCVDSDWGFEE
jgi:hypothetical protein